MLRNMAMLLATVLSGGAQTQVDLRTQSKNGAVAIENDGVTVGRQAVHNFIPGGGLVNALTDTGARIDIQQNVDTAVVQTRATAQSGSTLFCRSIGVSGSAYTCSLNPTLGAYTLGMVLFWRDRTLTGREEHSHLTWILWAQRRSNWPTGVQIPGWPTSWRGAYTLFGMMALVFV